MTDIHVQLIGYLASALIVIGFAPQTIKVIITKQTKDVSLVGYMIIFSGAMMFTLYGFLLAPMNWPIIITNACAGTLQFITIILKLRHG